MNDTDFTVKNKAMDTIKSIWFENGRIYMRSSGNDVYSRPLEAFPTLKEATEEQQRAFGIGKFGDDVRWADIDEDIHISSFYEHKEPEYDNEIARIFKRFPQLNVSEIARQIGIDKSLLSRYIYGIKKPSPQRAEQIKDALRLLGRELAVL